MTPPDATYKPRNRSSPESVKFPPLIDRFFAIGGSALVRVMFAVNVMESPGAELVMAFLSSASLLTGMSAALAEKEFTELPATKSEARSRQVTDVDRKVVARRLRLAAVV